MASGEQHGSGAGACRAAHRVSGALVTGAGSGIGAACAVRLAAAGYDVMCADRDGEAAALTASRLPGAQHAAIDVRSEGDLDRTVTQVLTICGSLEIVVAAAGIHRSGEPTTMSRASFDDVLAVNTTGSFLTARASARAMIDIGNGGSIVLMGSMNSVAISMPGQVAYAASKGGVLLLGKVLAVDLAEHDIRVNVILPGITDTPLSESTLADPTSRERSLGKVPMRRPALPEDIAEMVAFLASPSSRYVTGAALPVDGGQLAVTSDYPWVH